MVNGAVLVVKLALDGGVPIGISVFCNDVDAGIGLFASLREVVPKIDFTELGLIAGVVFQELQYQFFKPCPFIALGRGDRADFV